MPAQKCAAARHPGTERRDGSGGVEHIQRVGVGDLDGNTHMLRKARRPGVAVSALAALPDETVFYKPA